MAAYTGISQISLGIITDAVAKAEAAKDALNIMIDQKTPLTKEQKVQLVDAVYALSVQTNGINHLIARCTSLQDHANELDAIIDKQIKHLQQ